MAERVMKKHWPVMLLGGVVVIIFATVLFTFQVDETEYAVVIRFGRPQTLPESDKIKVYHPGLHWKWPAPVDVVWRHDKRLQAYDLQRGRNEQIQTADDYQVVVETYVLWRVGDPGTFLRAVETSSEAQDKIDDVVRSARNTTLGQHPLTELINPDADQVQIAQIEERILQRAQNVALEKYGIAIDNIGFKQIGFPAKVSQAVFDRMEAERKRKSQEFIAQGKRDARQIRARADLEAREITAQAEAAATAIRAEADQKAADYYKVFQQNPKLAAFLKKLDALRQTLTDKTTLVMDTGTPPYDLFQPGATDLIEKATQAPQKLEDEEPAQKPENNADSQTRESTTQ